MSVLRAILGRFARFLVRLARRLDPALVTTTDWVMPRRMAALRLRYPGAPDHWLRLAARYPAVADPIPDDPPPESEIEEHLFPPDRPRRQAERSNLAAERHEHAQALPPTARTRTARPIVAVARSRAGGTQLRPRLNFPPATERDPVVRLLRPDSPNARPQILRFRSADQPPRPAPDAQADPVRRAHVTVFPPLDAHATERPEWPSSPEADREPPTVEPHWPVLNRTAPAEPSWMERGWSAGRRESRFDLSDHRWPELPSLADESSSPLQQSRDEAALIAEQIGGTWSA
jgi:hypothetical protein